MNALRLFLRDIKPEHTLFALPFAYAGALLAYGGVPPLHTLAWITLAVVGARTAAIAPTLPLPWRSRKRANDRTPANVRMSERLAMPSARRAAMNARTSEGASFARRANVRRVPKCWDMKRRN